MRESRPKLKNSPFKTGQINGRLIGHVNNIPTMQFFTEISRNTQANSYML